jgi:hypothetical protein
MFCFMRFEFVFTKDTPPPLLGVENFFNSSLLTKPATTAAHTTANHRASTTVASH